jgi:hypothetical protein
VSPPSDKIGQFDTERGTRANLIRRFEWVTLPLSQGDTRRLVLELTSFLKEDENVLGLVLTSEGVRNLQFTALGLAEPFLQISEVSSQQRDGVVYQIADKKHDTLSFLRRDFSFSVSGATEQRES